MAKGKDKVQAEQAKTDEQLDKEREVESKAREGDVVAEAQDDDQVDEFRAQQINEAKSQGLTQDNAVPEKRDGPRAFEDNSALESEVTKRHREKGLLQEEPMPQSAYEKADSDAQKDQANEGSRTEAFAVGDMVRVVNEDSPHFGRHGAIVRCIYSQGAYAARTGQPEQRFINPDEFEVRSRGDEAGDQLMMLTPDDVERIGRRNWSNLGGPVHGTVVAET